MWWRMGWAHLTGFKRWNSPPHPAFNYTDPSPAPPVWPNTCRDQGDLLGGPIWLCELPPGHSGVHQAGRMTWDR